MPALAIAVHKDHSRRRREYRYVEGMLALQEVRNVDDKLSE